MHGFGHDWMYGGGWMMLGWLWMAIVFFAPVLIVLSLLKYLLGRRGTRGRARDLLDEAYARGEVSREEYLQKRADLNGA